MFLMRVLRNIDFLDSKIPDDVIEEITYKIKLATVYKDAYLFKQGKPCNEIYIVVNGELDIFVKNNEVYEVNMDTLYVGCSVGAYSVLGQDDYTISGRAKTDCTVIVISKELLDELRKQHDEVNALMNEYEDYIQFYGLPYCDYKLHRGKNYAIPPMKKFQNGIRRLIRIVRSQKINDLQGFLRKHIDTVKEEKKKESKSNAFGDALKESASPQPGSTTFDSQAFNTVEYRVNLLYDFILKQTNQLENLQKEVDILKDAKKRKLLRRQTTKKHSEDDIDPSSGDELDIQHKPMKALEKPESTQRKVSMHEDEGKV
jgi:CRP-like cAMP-binding protein